jgi:hypothetical protein
MFDMFDFRMLSADHSDDLSKYIWLWKTIGYSDKDIYLQAMDFNARNLSPLPKK